MTEQKPHDVSALARQWADAETLCDFLKTRAESIRMATQGTETSGKPISEMSSVEIAVLTLRGNTDLQAALAEAKRGISDEVVAGRIYCIGRRRDSLEFEKVPPSFWIGAKIDWGGDAVGRDDEEFMDLRVLTGSIAAPPEVQDEPRSGRPSKGNVILAAIEKYANDDPGLKGTKSKRFRSYRSYISEQGYDPRTDPGFGDKTIEKFETAYRKKKR